MKSTTRRRLEENSPRPADPASLAPAVGRPSPWRFPPASPFACASVHQSAYFLHAFLLLGVAGAIQYLRREAHIHAKKPTRLQKNQGQHSPKDGEAEKHACKQRKKHTKRSMIPPKTHRLVGRTPLSRVLPWNTCPERYSRTRSINQLLFQTQPQST